jgi:hypothetical protein
MGPLHCNFWTVTKTPYLLRYPQGSINGDASQFGVEQIKCSNETLLRSWVGTNTPDEMGFRYISVPQTLQFLGSLSLVYLSLFNL